MIKLLYGILCSYVRVSFTGLNTQYVLNVAAQNGILLKNVFRASDACLEADVPIKKLKKLSTLLGESYRIKPIKSRGIFYKMSTLKKRLGLFIGALLIAIGLFLMFSQVRTVDVSGSNSREILRLAEESGALTWKWRAGAYTDELERKISELESILWCSVEIDGVRLKIYVKEDFSVKGEEATDRICACKDGVLRNLVVYSGTACAQNGDTVSKGQVLISGQMKIGDSVYPVKAEGKALASVWYYDYAEIPVFELCTVETGRSVSFLEADILGLKSIACGKNQFREYTVEKEEINTFLLPISIRMVTCRETETVRLSDTLEGRIENTKNELILKLQSLLPQNATVCEINTVTEERDGCVLVGVYIETAEEIGIRG